MIAACITVVLLIIFICLVFRWHKENQRAWLERFSGNDDEGYEENVNIHTTKGGK